MDDMEERRRSPRREVQGELAIVPAVINVRVLDLNVAGLLLQSTDAVVPGTRGRLCLNLAGTSFTAEIEVQRVATSSEAGSGYRLGATFVALSPELGQLIERFITQ
jgi:hypothetical protein